MFAILYDLDTLEYARVWYGIYVYVGGFLLALGCMLSTVVFNFSLGLGLTSWYSVYAGFRVFCLLWTLNV